MRASETLFAAAADSRRESARMTEYALRLQGAWSEVQDTDFAGAGPVAALRRLEELSRWFGAPATALDHTADLLEAFATAQRRLEKVREALVALADFAQDAGLFRGELDGLLATIDGLGVAMDFACARGLEAVCTPEYVPAAVPFADRGDFSVDAIHELELLSAPPAVARLAADNPDVRVLETPGGGVVAAVGDIESAEAITTFVAGVHSSDPGSWQGQVDSTRTVARAMGPGTAGVVWLGYRAPDSVARGIQKEPARAGGRDLARFQRGLAERYPTAQLTVVGHSYGTVVASRAAQEGLRADDLVLLGSPGTGARHVSEFHLQAREGVEPRVFAATAQGDPITLTTGPAAGVHGRDPASPMFGARPWPSNNLGDHGSYFRDERFLDGFAQVRRGSPGAGSD